MKNLVITLFSVSLIIAIPASSIAQSKADSAIICSTRFRLDKARLGWRSGRNHSGLCRSAAITACCPKSSESSGRKKIPFRGRAETIGAGTEVNLVEVEFQDLLFRVGAFDAHSQ